MREPMGNLKQDGLGDILSSSGARSQRDAIARKECSCDHACFLQHSFLTEPRNLPHLLAGMRRAFLPS